jgi:hypothetical protein
LHEVKVRDLTMPDQATITVYAPIIISILALGVAGLSLLVSWRGHQRSVHAEEPNMSATLKAVPGQPNWFQVDITLTSRSSYGWRADTLTILRPRSGRVLTHTQALEEKKGGGPRGLKSPLPLEAAVRKLQLTFRVTRAGQDAPTFRGLRLGAGESHQETFFVFARRSSWSSTLSMRFNLLSIEPIERKSPVTIRRTLPQATNTAQA